MLLLDCSIKNAINSKNLTVVAFRDQSSQNSNHISIHTRSRKSVSRDLQQGKQKRTDIKRAEPFSTHLGSASRRM